MLLWWKVVELQDILTSCSDTLWIDIVPLRSKFIMLKTSGYDHHYLSHWALVTMIWCYKLWNHKMWSTLVQVMASCWMQLSHYSNRCWFVVSDVLWHIYTPRFYEVERGVYWYHLVRLSVRPSVRLSVCGQNRVRSVSSTILIGSISYLHILSSNFRRCVACNARFKIKKFEILANFLNL